MQIESKECESKLSVIVPIARMAGRMDLLFSWTERISNNKVQIILVHDKQDERTSVELLNWLAQLQHSNLKLIEGKYNSPGLARNAGIAIANGAWIQFVDSDDLPNIDGSLSLIENAKGTTDILVGRFTYWDSVNNRSWKLVTTQDPKLDLALNPGIWRIIFRRHCALQSQFSHYRMGEDQLFLLENGIFHWDLEFSDLEIYRYTVGHNSQLTAQTWALRELRELIPHTLKAYSRSVAQEEKYVAIVVARQLLTFSKFAFKSHEISRRIYFDLGINHLSVLKQFRIATSLLIIVKNRNKYVNL